MLRRWYRAWDAHDLEAVLELFHDRIVFENWTGARVEGKEALRRAWGEWFAGADFRFEEEETFVDVMAQKALYRWTLRWPSREPGREGWDEVRRGVDVLHFEGGRIVRKLTYCRTGLEIGGERVRLAAPPPSAGRGRTP
ncbi:MAG: nuclear transport factor 2 family protein [Proteobacteria bacterium]|nr:nuclear transport factor 2 family protein [Pseudomonadota bacterium]